MLAWMRSLGDLQRIGVESTGSYGAGLLGSVRIVCVPWQGASFFPVEIRAGKLSLQPEAIGADQEATNDLKHFDRKAP